MALSHRLVVQYSGHGSYNTRAPDVSWLSSVALLFQREKNGVIADDDSVDGLAVDDVYQRYRSGTARA